ncbi:MAG: DUF4340 domain-containing protein [Magnetococcales bacterium]|nr:DUF4340 domain-containing protein [Magnetococcales bacterium]MBF0114534.1 DUF4340 domain-containing protein [Magnetococcales bacterium]
MSESSPMAKGWRMPLVLLLVLISGIALLWWLEQRETQRTSEEKSARLIGKFSPSAVKKLEFWRPATEKGKEGNTLTIVRNDLPKTPVNMHASHWQIVAPERVRTNDQAVEKLLEILTESYDQQVTQEPNDRAAFGLESPLAVLTVYNEAEQALQISLGLSAPASHKRYVQIGVDGPVVLVPAKSIDGLMQSKEALRDKRLFANQLLPSIQTFSRERPNEHLELGKKEKQWYLRRPLQDLASEERVSQWLQALVLAKGSTFVALQADESSTVHEDWLLAMHLSQEFQERVRIQRRDNRLLAWRAGEPDAMVLDSHLSDELDKPALELIALRPVEQAAQLHKMAITHQGKTVQAEKKNNEWSKPVWKGIEEEVLTRDAWHGVQAKERGEPWLSITVWQEQQQRTIPFWKVGEAIFLAPPNRPMQLELTHFQAKAFQETIKALFAEE